MQVFMPLSVVYVTSAVSQTRQDVNEIYLIPPSISIKGHDCIAFTITTTIDKHQASYMNQRELKEREVRKDSIV